MPKSKRNRASASAIDPADPRNLNALKRYIDSALSGKAPLPPASKKPVPQPRPPGPRPSPVPMRLLNPAVGGGGGSTIGGGPAPRGQPGSQTAKVGRLVTSNGNAVLTHHVANQMRTILNPKLAQGMEFPDGMGIDGNIVSSMTSEEVLLTTTQGDGKGVMIEPWPAELIKQSTFGGAAGTYATLNTAPTIKADSLYATAINVASVQSVRCLGLMVEVTSVMSTSSAAPDVNVWMGRRLTAAARTGNGVGFPAHETMHSVLGPPTSGGNPSLSAIWVPTDPHDYHPSVKTATAASNDNDGSPLIDRPVIHLEFLSNGTATRVKLTVYAIWSLQLAQTHLYAASPVRSPNSSLAKDATLNICASVVRDGAWYHDDPDSGTVTRFTEGLVEDIIRGGARLLYNLAEGAWLDFTYFLGARPRRV